MSTRPYATHGGLRIRQCYNQRLIQYRQRCSTESSKMGIPIGARQPDWDRWVLWTRSWEAALIANRDLLIERAEQQAKEQRNERKRDRGKRCPRGT